MILKFARDYLLVIALAFLSVLIGGWISKELFFEDQKHRNTVLKVFILIMVSVSCTFLVFYKNYLLPDDNDLNKFFDGCLHSSLRASFLLFLVFVLVPIQVIRYSYKRKWYQVFIWLLPVTYMLFALFILPKYFYELEYINAIVNFKEKEKYYIDIVNKTPEEKNASPKLMVFNFGGGEQIERLIVYDESDDMMNSLSNHKRMYETWYKNQNNGILRSNTYYTMYHIKPKKIKGHFYLVIIDYANLSGRM